MTGPVRNKAYMLSGAWTEERIALLKRMVESGAAFSECGRALGCTRNAAQGKARRMGFQQPSAASTPSARSASPLRPKLPPNQIPRAIIWGAGTPTLKDPTASNPKLWAPLAGTTPLKIIDLKPLSCRWPVDVPDWSEQGYCGCLAIGGRYCLPHAARARPSAPPVSAKDLIRSLRRVA